MGRCSDGSCKRQPSFNLKSKRTAAYCRQHAVDGMVRVGGRRCSHDSCTRQPSFNLEGSKRAVYCRQHAEDGMVNVRRRRCSYDSCVRQPTFSIACRKTAAYCRQHAEDGMGNVFNMRCSHVTCTTEPSFNVEGIKTGSYRKQHAADGMMNVKQTKRCSRNFCTRQPRWGVLTDGAATVCHHNKGDILGFPVINFREKCKGEGCGTESRWGLDGEQPTYCRDHGPLKNGLVCTVGTASRKRRGCSPSHNTARGPSLDVKSECLV